MSEATEPTLPDLETLQSRIASLEGEVAALVADPRLATVAKIVPQPGEILAVNLETPLSELAMGRIVAALDRAFGPGVKVVVCEPGFRFVTVSAEEETGGRNGD